MIYTLEDIRERAVPIAKKYGIERFRLFGSYSRNEARDDSDLDFIISDGRIRSLFDYCALVLDLEEAFGCHVDVVMDGSSDAEFLQRIKADEVVLYEAG